MRLRLRSNERGFSLIDMMAVVAIIGIVSAIALPSMLGAMERVRLGQSTREVERELQTAKSRAVVKGRAMRVRFDCPADGTYRTVELIGTTSVPVAADASDDRCDEVDYPFPAGDEDPTTLPNLDGPVRRLDPTVSFSAAQTIEFRANGTAFYEATAGDFDLIPVAGISITLERNGVTSTITVNGLGKVERQQ
jgi:prepilin-type N-terminal cleavage/methylation domain-containing protein